MILVRSRAYYRHQRERVIKKKMKIVKAGLWYIYTGKEGSLSKGKVHCSCPICSNKTKYIGWRKNDLSKINQMKNEIDEYLNKTE